MGIASRCLTLLSAAVHLATAVEAATPITAFPLVPSGRSHPAPPKPASANPPLSPDDSSVASAAHFTFASAAAPKERVPAPAVASSAAPVAAGVPAPEPPTEPVDIGIIISAGSGHSQLPTRVAVAQAAQPGVRDCETGVLDSTIYDRTLHSYSASLTEMIAMACGPDWRGIAGELVGRMSGWSFSWAQVTGRVDAPCSTQLTPAGSAATGCAWSEASAYAAAYALADVHTTAAATAFAEHCAPRCAALPAGGWDFAGPDVTLLLLADTYAKATTAACAEGQKSKSASEWSLCYGGILGDTVTQALVRALLSAGCFDGPMAVAVGKGLEALAASGGLCFAARS